MPRQGLGHSSVDIYNMVTPGTDDPVWKHPGAGQLMMGYQQTRSNFVLFSQDTTDAEAWTKGNTAIDSTLYEAPDNSTTANAIKSNSTGEKVYKITQTSLSVTAGKTYTLSVHVKKENLGFARIYFSDGAAKKADFNLTTGAVGSTSNTIKTSVDSMDDGWFRCSMTFVATSTVSSGQVRFSALAADGDNTPSVAVSGIVLLYVWGWQLEENSEMSAYIVTTNAARTTTETLNDTSETWDFDSADLMPEADPDDDGVWEVPANIVLNGDYEELGSELVTNGTFDADSNWIKGTGWAISSGVATSDGSQSSSSNLYQVVYIIGKTYKTQLTVNAINGTLKIFTGTGTPSLTITSAGTYDFTTKADSSTVLFIQAQASTTVTIDNVSVKQVDPNNRWTLTGGTSISDGKMTVTGASGTSLGFQSMLAQGTAYELTYTISNFSSSSGDTKVIDDNANTIQNISANGTFTVIFTHAIASGNLIFRATSGTNSYQVDNVTVKEYAIQPQDV